MTGEGLAREALREEIRRERRIAEEALYESLGSDEVRRTWEDARTAYATLERAQAAAKAARSEAQHALAEHFGLTLGVTLVEAGGRRFRVDRIEPDYDCGSFTCSGVLWTAAGLPHAHQRRHVAAICDVTIVGTVRATGEGLTR